MEEKEVDVKKAKSQKEFASDDDNQNHQRDLVIEHPPTQHSEAQKTKGNLDE